MAVVRCFCDPIFNGASIIFRIAKYYSLPEGIVYRTGAAVKTPELRCATFRISNTILSHAEKKRAGATARGDGGTRQGTCGHPRVLAGSCHTDADGSRAQRRNACGDSAALPADARGARLRHPQRTQLPPPAQGTGAGRRLPRIDEHRAAHEDAPGGARTRHVRFRRVMRVGRHDRSSTLPARRCARCCDSRRTLAAIFPPMRHPRAASCSRGLALERLNRYFETARFEAFTDRTIVDPDRLRKLDRRLPPHRLLGSRGRTRLRSGRARRAGVGSARAGGRRAQHLQPFAPHLQGQVGARAAGDVAAGEPRDLRGPGGRSRVVPQRR